MCGSNIAMKMLVEEYLGKDRKLHAAFTELEKAYVRVDREALWDVLMIYGVEGQLMEGIRTFYREMSTFTKVDGKLIDNFATGPGVKQGSVMLLWLFDILLDECMRKMKAKVFVCQKEAESECWEK